MFSCAAVFGQQLSLQPHAGRQGAVSGMRSTDANDDAAIGGTAELGLLSPVDIY